MAIQLKVSSSSSSTLSSRWKSIALSSVLLVLVFIGLYSQPLLFDTPSTAHRLKTPTKLHASPDGIVDMQTGHDRPLVVYAYAESDNARDNLKFFLQRGLHAQADFIFIFNGETDASDLVPKNLENIKVVKRENTCYDIGAFGQILAKDGLWMRYKRFITLNASLRGPFVPVWSNDCWTDAFLSKITDEVKVCARTRTGNLAIGATIWLGANFRHSSSG